MLLGSDHWRRKLSLSITALLTHIPRIPKKEETKNTKYHEEGGDNVKQNDGKSDEDGGQRGDDSHREVEPQANILLPECEDNPVWVVRQTTHVGEWLTDSTYILSTEVRHIYYNKII